MDSFQKKRRNQGQYQPRNMKKKTGNHFDIYNLTHSRQWNFDLHRSILNLHKNYLPITILSSDFNAFIWQIYTLVQTVNILGITICNPAFLELVQKRAWWWSLRTETCSLAPIKTWCVRRKLFVILIWNMSGCSWSGVLINPL